MDIRGIKDDNAKLVRCPVCGKPLLFVSDRAEGVIYPYCKGCRKNVRVECRKA